jgi:hypothetical protein
MLKAPAMSLDVITIKEQQGMPRGSVLQNCSTTHYKGVECWKGLWSSMWGSYIEIVPKEDCEIWDEEKHDPMYVLKKYLAQKNEIRVESEERATLKRLKAKYEGE